MITGNRNPIFSEVGRRFKDQFLVTSSTVLASSWQTGANKLTSFIGTSVLPRNRPELFDKK
jgi:hypothetical protein